MRVSRAQADENRATVIKSASRLFRERGFDGIGLNDLMKAAGLTHGAFYKQFKSKEDLAVQASDHALGGNIDMWSKIAAGTADDPLSALVRFYLSEDHRDFTAEGCTFAALGTDAARSGPALRRAFQAGVETHLEALDAMLSAAPDEATRDASIAILSSMLGALLLSRVVDDEALSRRILDATAGDLLARLEAGGRKAVQ